MGSSCAETSGHRRSNIGEDGSSTTVTVAENLAGSKTENPAATPSTDLTVPSSTSHTSTINSSVVSSGGVCKEGLISVQSSSFRWVEDDEGQLADPEEMTGNVTVPENSRGAKITIYKDDRTDGTQDQANSASDETMSNSEGRSGGVDMGGVSVGSPAVEGGQGRRHKAGEIENRRASWNGSESEKFPDVLWRCACSAVPCLFCGAVSVEDVCFVLTVVWQGNSLHYRVGG